MIEAQSLFRFSTSLLSGLAAILCNGCATDGAGQQAAYDRKIQRTEHLLIAAGDADSLAAAAMLSVGPTFDPARRLTLAARAVSKAPDRPDLVWLNVRLCPQVDTCNPGPLEAQLRALDPGNGAAWFDSFWRAGRRNDLAAMHKDLSAIATSRSFDTYWNATISHITNAIVKTHTMDLPTALVATIGAASATVVPPYQAILNACKGDPLQDADRLNICRQVSTVMRGGDTYMTEMIGIAIAKRAWPEGSPAYVDAIGAGRVAHYRMDADAKPSLRRFLFSGFAAKRLQLMMKKTSEQEVILAEILNAGGNPDPPSDYSDGSNGS